MKVISNDKLARLEAGTDWRCVKLHFFILRALHSGSYWAAAFFTFIYEYLGCGEYGGEDGY